MLLGAGGVYGTSLAERKTSLARWHPVFSNFPLNQMKSPRFSRPLRPILTFLALATGSAAISSCRTTEGFGRDVQKVGNKIANEAERHG
jgi:predicted small secreted protein